jgi:predicted CopG family antitoxin
MFGGADQGFMDMGLIDIPFVGGALDAIDAYGRLEKTKEEDRFSDGQERLIQSMPFAVKVASILLPGDNDIKDYYDGKKMDLATLYGGPLGFLGVSSATGNFLSKLSRKVDDAPIIGQTMKKMMPNLGGLPDEVPYHLMPEYRAADPDAAIKGDKYANVFEAANRKFKGQDYDE